MSQIVQLLNQKNTSYRFQFS